MQSWGKKFLLYSAHIFYSRITRKQVDEHAQKTEERLADLAAKKKASEESRAKSEMRLGVLLLLDIVSGFVRSRERAVRELSTRRRFVADCTPSLRGVHPVRKACSL